MINKQIFIIDDDDDLNAVLKEFFEQRGITSYVYTEPPDLKKELEEKNPHTVLLDIVFKKISGLELLEQIKKLRPNMPVIMMTGFADQEKNLDSLRKGAYAFLAKPFSSFEGLFHTVNNAISYYIEFLRTSELTGEIQKQREIEKLNLIELEFLKTLQHMIGEAEKPASILKNFFGLLKTFIPFDIFATLVQDNDEILIEIFPNVIADKKVVDFVSKTLSERMSNGGSVEKCAKVIMNDEKAAPRSDDGAFNYVISDLSTKSRVYGHAGLFRTSSFNLNEEATFNRFCSHISLALEKIRLFNEIKLLSIHDSLTGVYNHAFIVKALEEEVGRSERYGSHLTALLLDIDDFKRVNDTYGHLAGDFVLKRVAKVLEAGMRNIDIVGRYGGEEFLVILPETVGEQGFAVSERLRSDIETENFVYGDDVIKVTVSGGIACYSHGVDAKEIIKLADDNMYKAKKVGKNRIYYERE
jgi:diguanylate cyclase (GGDEF)-like protein